MLSKSKLSLCVAVALSASVGIGVLLSLPPAGEVEASAAPLQDADQVKASIVEQFRDHPEAFTVAAAAARLADARVDGFAVCVATVEATAEQYVSVASYIDQARKHAGAFKSVVDHVMDQPQGMSDCDFRVISAIARLTK